MISAIGALPVLLAVSLSAPSDATPCTNNGAAGTSVSQTHNQYCPVWFVGIWNGVYYYYAAAVDGNIDCDGPLHLVTSDEPVFIGCNAGGKCFDPISGSAHDEKTRRNGPGQLHGANPNQFKSIAKVPGKEKGPGTSDMGAGRFVCGNYVTVKCDNVYKLRGKEVFFRVLKLEIRIAGRVDERFVAQQTGKPSTTEIQFDPHPNYKRIVKLKVAGNDPNCYGLAAEDI